MPTLKGNLASLAAYMNPLGHREMRGIAVRSVEYF